MLFLHGNGERGDGKAELDYVLMHGPLFEAWAQKRDLPFVIISPQLPMFDQGEVSYIKNRTRAEIPTRLPEGIHAYPSHYNEKVPLLLQGQLADPNVPFIDGDDDVRGWNTIANEVMGMLDHT